MRACSLGSARRSTDARVGRRGPGGGASGRVARVSAPDSSPEHGRRRPVAVSARTRSVRPTPDPRTRPPIGGRYHAVEPLAHPALLAAGPVVPGALSGVLRREQNIRIGSVFRCRSSERPCGVAGPVTPHTVHSPVPAARRSRSTATVTSVTKARGSRATRAGVNWSTTDPACDERVVSNTVLVEGLRVVMALAAVDLHRQLDVLEHVGVPGTDRQPDRRVGHPAGDAGIDQRPVRHLLARTPGVCRDLP